MSKDKEDAFESAAQACRYYLKHQNFPPFDYADEYQRGVIVACENLEQRMLELAKQEAANYLITSAAPDAGKSDDA